MAGLAPGQVIGDRFEIAGVLGQGGTATVYLATDRLRKQRIALKVLHPHLVSDPGMRARLRREVEAAGLLRHEAALVAWDLHELDGHLALSMPFHRGQTLTEHVAARGALSAAQVRQLGIRIAGALADAHRQGVLHRDVSPANVLIDGTGDAVLTDFGLARVGEGGGTRSTGLLGTAGYAAPEVYAGQRRDPRSDLYGLGGILYLAATGHAPFEGPTPMGILQRQLDDAWTPLGQARPELPAPLAATIEALLRCEPSERPAGAREVSDALELRREPQRPATVPTRALVLPALTSGRYTVIVKEKTEDRGRREAIRVDLARAAPSAETELRRWAGRMMTNIRAAVGLAAGPTPEDLLAMAVAEEAGLPRDALMVPPGMTEKRFRLVDRVDRDVAHRLARAARDAGFRATVANVDEPPTWIAQALPTIVSVVVAFVVAVLIVAEGLVTWAVVLAMIVAGAVLFVSRQQQRTLDPELPEAFGTDLSRWLTGDYTADASRVPEAPPTRGQELLARARAQLDQLGSAIADQRADLPQIAIRDLRSTLAELRSSAEALGGDVDRLEAAVDERAAEADASWMQGRLDRLQTMQRAGERVDAEELRRLTSALEAQRSADAAAEALDSQLTACLAQLLEIASAAARVRRELLKEPDPSRSADRLVARLRDETRAAADARRETAKRQAAARSKQRS